MNQNRGLVSQHVRDSASELAKSRGPVQHLANGEEYRYRNAEGLPTHIANFTKGLPHDPETGLLLNPADYQRFIRGIDSGDPADFIATPLGPASDPTQTENPVADCPTQTAFQCGKPIPASPWQSTTANEGNNGKPVTLRAWEASAVGQTFDLQGPDALSVTMPPAPGLDSYELAAEMAEVYAQSLLRDKHLSEFREPIAGHGPIEAVHDYPDVKHCDSISTDQAITLLNLQEWFGLDHSTPGLTEPERSRLRPGVTRGNAFRGITPGDDMGPYLSQFLLIGNSGINGSDQSRNLSDGKITYGSIQIDQRVRVAVPTVDYMTDFATYVDVQNAARLSGSEAYVDPKCKLPYRFITTPRDLATYVHYDALYEAYLNACLVMLGLGVPFDRGLPFQFDDIVDHQQGFAQFGGPHILSLVCEVATRALKAVRFQKFNIHRRLRPEALAARVAKFDPKNEAFRPIRTIKERLERQVDGRSMLDWVSDYNKLQNGSTGSALLPMAFPEGSPMHPAYGAGHATVAGACVTILKAFFDSGTLLVEKLEDGTSRPICYEPNADGSALVSLVAKQGEESRPGFVKSYGAKRVDEPSYQEKPVVQYDDFYPLSVEGELNKLASNISIGRDWAGVHYFTDYIESLRMGEAIAIGLLEEQKLTYRENFSMTIPLFDGGSVRI